MCNLPMNNPPHRERMLPHNQKIILAYFSRSLSLPPGYACLHKSYKYEQDGKL